LRKLFLVIPLFLLLAIPVHATPLQADNYPEIEPQLIRCTVYTAEEGDITADGSKVREGIVAGKREWLGYTCIMYENDNGEIGDLIGIYEFKDTGAGIDTDGDGKGDSIKKGLSIDVYRDTLERCNEWIEEYGDYVFVQIVYGVG
jgi:3D (Asp-Asp-Asp) domain-containing protein